MRTATALLIAILALSACVPQGDFCDLAEDLRTTADVSAYIFDNDEPMARRLAVHNQLVQGCG